MQPHIQIIKMSHWWQSNQNLHGQINGYIFLKVETQVRGSWDQQILTQGCCDRRPHRRSPRSRSLIWPLKKVLFSFKWIKFTVSFHFLTFFPLSLLVLDLHPSLIVHRVPSHLSPVFSKSWCTKKKGGYWEQTKSPLKVWLEETSKIWEQRMGAKKLFTYMIKWQII